MNELVKSLESISALTSLKILLEENLLELLDCSIKNGDSDLITLDSTSELLLEVWVSSLKRFLNNVVFVGLHYFVFKNLNFN